LRQPTICGAIEGAKSIFAEHRENSIFLVLQSNNFAAKWKIRNVPVFEVL